MPTGKVPVESIAYAGDGIYVGSRDAAVRELLAAEGITHVLTFASSTASAPSLPPDLQHKVVVIADTDDTELVQSYESHGVAPFIDSGTEAGRAVLVHCDKGCSRSVAMVLLYLVDTKGATVAQAFKRFLIGKEGQRRLIIGPRINFVDALYSKNASKVDFGGRKVDLPGTTSIDMAQRKRSNEEYTKSFELVEDLKDSRGSFKNSLLFQRYSQESTAKPEAYFDMA